MNPVVPHVDSVVPAGHPPETEFSGAPAAQACRLVDLQHWLSTAERGSTLVYHHGFLALDRGAGSRLGEDAGEELDRIGTALMTMAEAGHVHLMQRRHGPCDYSYLAVASAAGARFRTGRGLRRPT